MLRALIRAHVAALAWMRGARWRRDLGDDRAVVSGRGRPALYRRAVERYHRLGVWSSDATLPRASFDRLADLMHRGGLIERVAPYEACCDDSPDRAALATRLEAVEVRELGERLAPGRAALRAGRAGPFRASQSVWPIATSVRTR